MDEGIGSQELPAMMQATMRRLEEKNQQLKGCLVAVFGQGEKKFLAFPTPFDGELQVKTGPSLKTKKFLIVTTQGFGFIQVTDVRLQQKGWEGVSFVDIVSGNIKRIQEPDIKKEVSDSRYEEGMIFLAGDPDTLHVGKKGSTHYRKGEGTIRLASDLMVLTTDVSPDEVETTVRQNLERAERESRGIKEQAQLPDDNDPHLQAARRLLKDLL